MAVPKRAEPIGKEALLNLIYQEMNTMLKKLKDITRKLESGWLVASTEDDLSFIINTLCPRFSAALENLKEFVSNQSVIVYIDGMKERLRFLKIWAENWKRIVIQQGINEVNTRNEFLYNGIPNIAKSHLQECFNAYEQLRRDTLIRPYLQDVRTLRAELATLVQQRRGAKAA